MAPAGRLQGVSRRTRPGAARGVLSSPVMAAAMERVEVGRHKPPPRRRDGVFVSLEPRGERRACNDRLGRVDGVRNTDRGRTLFQIPSTPGPLYPSDGRCAGQIVCSEGAVVLAWTGATVHGPWRKARRPGGARELAERDTRGSRRSRRSCRAALQLCRLRWLAGAPPRRMVCLLGLESS